MQAKLLRFSGTEGSTAAGDGRSDSGRREGRGGEQRWIWRAARRVANFVEDLFYRLAAFPLELPPLCERRADIVPLAEHFLACMAAALETKPCPSLSRRLGPYLWRLIGWKGNVRELAARHGAGVDLSGERGHGFDRASLFSLSTSPPSPGEPVPFVRRTGKLREIL
jgi:transcriptional regulator of aromatic amino acid metabolism